MSSIQPVYRQFLKIGFPLPSEAQVRALERRIKVDFPEDYRGYLLEFNGGFFIEPEIAPIGAGCPEDALSYLNGLNATHPGAELGSIEDMNLFDDNDPPKIVPIGGTVTGGLIILDTAPGEGRGDIYLKEAYGGYHWLADGIEGFFALLREPLPDDPI